MAAKQTSVSKVKSSKLKRVAPFLYGGLLAVALLFGGFYFVKYQQLQDQYASVTMTEEQRAEKVVKEVAQYIELPKDEKPIIREVGDKSKLSQGPASKKFFEGVENGDVVLAYQKADKAYIYRSSAKKIVKTDTYTNFVAAANPIKVAIIAPNEQQTATEQSIYTKVLNVEVVGKAAPQAAATGSYVADVSGSNAKAAQELAEKLGFSVGQLPADEKKPEGEAVLVVVVAPPAPPQQ